MRWRHVVINTRNTWLHGDERGFRSRGHRIDSSGDYQHRPPPDEHEGLREYHESRSGVEVHVPMDLRPIIGRTILEYLLAIGMRVIAIAVGKVHTHIVVELVDDMRFVKHLIGQVKRKSSRAVKQQLPGAVWSAGGTYKPIDDTPPIKDGNHEGMFRRRRPKKR
jgi:hypothetical protein